MRGMILLASVALVTVAVMAAMAMPAFGAASSQASCDGIGGSTQTALFGPGARAAVSHDAKQGGEEEGTNPGFFFSADAKNHGGDREGCGFDE